MRHYAKTRRPCLILREFQRDIHCKKVQWSNEIWAQRSSADVGQDESSSPQFGITPAFSACRRPLNCRLWRVKSLLRHRSDRPKRRLTHRPDGLPRQPPDVALSQLAGTHTPARRHIRFRCSFLLLPSFNADNDAPPGALCTVSVTLLAAGIGLVGDGDVAL
jgi:hypothetical protein